jgi:ABC-type branched-subunit amino acid transport system ATPase component
MTELAEYGAGVAVRTSALRTLEEWFPPRRTEEIALSARDISLSFGGVKALRGATLSVPTGSFTGLIGPNGAGKTTLFDVVSGLQRADHGTVQIFGEDVTTMKPWRRAELGMTRTFQSTRVIKELGVGDNLLAGAGLRIPGSLPQFILGDPRPWREVRKAEEAAWAIAQLLNIENYWDERVGELEFSARRRTELGRALLSGPQILLLDEPTSGLDPASSGALISLVRQLQIDLGLTVLLVEHYVKAVLEGCDLVYVLAEGQILASGEPTEVAANAEVQEHYLGAGFGHSATPWRERTAASPGSTNRG